MGKYGSGASEYKKPCSPVLLQMLQVLHIHTQESQQESESARD